MPVDTLETHAARTFADRFGGEATSVAFAPGRVELLGNHTDYNEGYVLAATIDRFSVVVGRAVEGRRAGFRSIGFRDEEAFDLDTVAPGSGPADAWGRYVRGVAWAMREAGGTLALPGGVEAVIAGNIPRGAGLSSSASLQASVALFLLGPASRLTDDDRMALARVLQRSENDYVGVASGLLDQFSVLFGRSGHALTLDCRTHEYARLPLGATPPAIVVCDTKTSRRLADGMYNRRRAECERIVTFFRERPGGQDVRSLRDVTTEQLQAAWDDLDPVGRLRARHVLSENDRVLRGAEALASGEIRTFGRCMSASHASSRDDFANSSKPLDDLVESAERAPGFLGGKLSGAGWAGCTVNLVGADRAGAFAESVTAEYARRTGVVPAVHVCLAADGASCRPRD